MGACGMRRLVDWVSVGQRLHAKGCHHHDDDKGRHAARSNVFRRKPYLSMLSAHIVYRPSTWSRQSAIVGHG